MSAAVNIANKEGACGGELKIIEEDCFVFPASLMDFKTSFVVEAFIKETLGPASHSKSSGSFFYKHCMLCVKCFTRH